MARIGAVMSACDFVFLEMPVVQIPAFTHGRPLKADSVNPSHLTKRATDSRDS